MSVYYEFKAVPSKKKIYRYWYLRFTERGRLRSIYLGRHRPLLSPQWMLFHFREQRKHLIGTSYSLKRTRASKRA